MGGLIPASAWAKFKALQNKSHEDYMNKTIIWRRNKGFLQEFNEDYPKDSNGYTDIELPVLCNFNYERTWPITQDTETGDIDRQSCQLFFSKEQLKQLGYINADGNFDYNPGTDKFILNGIQWHPEGDTPAGQVPGDDLIFTLIIRPDTIATGEKSR